MILLERHKNEIEQQPKKNTHTKQQKNTHTKQHATQRTTQLNLFVNICIF